jgi:ribosomal protein S18 acetylase RimI-like enzyme
MTQILAATLDDLAATLDDPRAQPLLDALEAGYRRDYGEFVAADFRVYDAREFLPPTGALLLLVSGAETVAGGALRRLADGVGEVKRMWTAPEHRRRGHARRVLAALERRAIDYGYRMLRLETATLQAEAIELYRSNGYRTIAQYGRLSVDPRCVCFEKQL